MLWDGSFQAWIDLQLTGQPSAVLLAPDGTELGRWWGMVPEDEVLALAANA